MSNSEKKTLSLFKEFEAKFPSKIFMIESIYSRVMNPDQNRIQGSVTRPMRDIMIFMKYIFCSVSL